MELNPTWRGDYVVRAALELARRYAGGEWHKADEVARSTKIPPGYIRQILRMLVQHGIAEARTGAAGGYRLNSDPALITVLDVVEIGEGPLANYRCVLRGTGCNPRRPCAVHSVFARAGDALRQEMEATSLSELVAPASRAG
jgi:Rrf2 family protein